MGAYINPKYVSKELWLEEHATGRYLVAPTWSDVPEGDLPVCLVNNGPFTTAGICYSERELKEFARPDASPRAWFRVPIEKLHDVSPELRDYLRS